MPVIQGDCLEILPLLREEGLQVQAVVTDPPYGLSFMGKYWDEKDNVAFQSDTWKICLDLLAPGGHLVAFGGTRTYHRLCVAIEDAGFEIRDQLAWVYGTGMPKGLNVAKSIEKAGGTPEQAQQWDGWNTGLKPAWEPIVLARKPLVGSVAACVLQHGTGAININPNRIPIDAAIDDPRLGGKGTWGTEKMAKNVYEGGYEGIRVGSSPLGRFPPNVIQDGSPEVIALFGEAHRFFYCPKASRKERRESSHPTVKPLDLMRWLVRLVTPPGGVILDPFAGTGTTGEAAQLEGFECIMIERDPEYFKDAENRLTIK